MVNKIYSITLLMLLANMVSCKDDHPTNTKIITQNNTVDLYIPDYLVLNNIDTSFYLLSRFVRQKYISKDSTTLFTISYSILNTDTSREYDFDYYYNFEETQEGAQDGVIRFAEKRKINGKLYGRFYSHLKKCRILNDQYFTKIGNDLFYFTLVNLKYNQDSVSHAAMYDSIMMSLEISRVR